MVLLCNLADVGAWVVPWVWQYPSNLGLSSAFGLLYFGVSLPFVWARSFAWSSRFDLVSASMVALSVVMELELWNPAELAVVLLSLLALVKKICKLA